MEEDTLLRLFYCVCFERINLPANELSPPIPACLVRKGK